MTLSSNPVARSAHRYHHLAQTPFRQIYLVNVHPARHDYPPDPPGSPHETQHRGASLVLTSANLCRLLSQLRGSHQRHAPRSTGDPPQSSQDPEDRLISALRGAQPLVQSAETNGILFTWLESDQTVKINALQQCSQDATKDLRLIEQTLMAGQPLTLDHRGLLIDLEGWCLKVQRAGLGEDLNDPNDNCAHLCCTPSLVK